MKKSTSSKTLDRGAFSDIWRNTLSQIPSVFGRLVYLTSLRDQNSGRYSHHGLALLFGEDESNKALKKNHLQAFGEWLSFDLEQQKADLDLYLSDLLEDRRTVVETWAQQAYYRTLVPNSAAALERKLYLSDFKALLSLLKNEYGVSSTDPDA